MSVAAGPHLASRAHGQPPALRFEEITINDLQAAFRNKQTTCRRVVEFYLQRIEVYDKRGPAINSIVMIKQVPSPRQTIWTGGLQAPDPSGRSTAFRSS